MAYTLPRGTHCKLHHVVGVGMGRGSSMRLIGGVLHLKSVHKQTASHLPFRIRLSHWPMSQKIKKGNPLGSNNIY